MTSMKLYAVSEDSVLRRRPVGEPLCQQCKGTAGSEFLGRVCHNCQRQRAEDCDGAVDVRGSAVQDQTSAAVPGVLLLPGAQRRRGIATPPGQIRGAVSQQRSGHSRVLGCVGDLHGHLPQSGFRNWLPAGAEVEGVCCSHMPSRDHCLPEDRLEQALCCRRPRHMRSCRQRSSRTCRCLQRAPLACLAALLTGTLLHLSTC